MTDPLDICVHAMSMAGAPTLTGEVLAARHHIIHCPRCQAALTRLQADINVLPRQQTLTRIFNLDLSNTVTRTADGVITWVSSSTGRIVGDLHRLRLSSGPAPTLSLMGPSDTIIGRSPFALGPSYHESDDGGLTWEAIGQRQPDDSNCTVSIKILRFDEQPDDWENIPIALLWDSEERHVLTDDEGVARFQDVPFAALGRIEVFIYRPQHPSTTNEP